MRQSSLRLRLVAGGIVAILIALSIAGGGFVVLFERHVADKEKPATHDGAVQIASQAAANAWQAVSTAHRNALEATRNDVSPIRARSQVQEAKSASAPPSCVANWILS